MPYITAQCFLQATSKSGNDVCWNTSPPQQFRPGTVKIVMGYGFFRIESVALLRPHIPVSHEIRANVTLRSDQKMQKQPRIFTA